MLIFKRYFFHDDNNDVPNIIYVENRTTSLYFAFWEKDNNGEDLSGIFKNHKGLRGRFRYEAEYPLSLFQSHPQFKDASAFGIPHKKDVVIYASVDPGKQTYTGFYGYLQDKGYYTAVIFPDTESTFDDVIVTVPYVDSNTIVLHNGTELSVNVVPYTKLDKHCLPIMHYIFPKVTLNGPSTMSVDDQVTLELTVGEGPLQLGSLFSVLVSSDNGYTPKRYMVMEEGSSTHIKVRSDGLDPGDTITVYAGLPQYHKMCNHRITIQR